ncbi:centriole, cilia and spindle-associated protein [Nerophis lumbriciformis]|uniref:centriole, cilia and spindle-associated protein n=1 Tax=Nerophis lumbriciformis TaxID=546530 RepID=UPI002AE041DA|nr:centriole, cilia and spindle-associated protein-like [Nerophis lumbriciformis]
MVTRKIRRSEYMKKYKDPKWETYTKCYEELVKYRLSRRLLEQTHKPWIWNLPDSDSETGEAKSPGKGEGPPRAKMEACQGPKADVPRLPGLQEERGNDCHQKEVRESCAAEGHTGEQSGRKHKREPHEDAEVPQPPPSKPRRLSKSSRLQRVKSVVQQPPKDHSKHPFALYASGEKDADTAGKKTHNVLPIASTSEIHASALRAKTRREAERQVQTQRNERRIAKSTDKRKARKKVRPDFNPWLTEYMRCFSGRTR